MTVRDRLIIVVVLVAAALAAFWFVGLAPKRKEAGTLSSQIDVASKKLAQAQQSAAQARQAKAHYNDDYAEVATLGKAVPKSDALPSLLYQLQSAAHGARIDFKSLKVSGSGTPAASAATPAAATASTATGTNPGSPSKASPAPATQAASATLPPGASVGSAGFPTMPFSFVFNGSFPDMQSFLRDVQRFVRVEAKRVDVRGRLLSIDGISLTAGPGGFPAVNANISATAYLMAPGDDTTPAGSGSASPAGAGTAAPTAAANSEVAR
jgi:Tfp pilus assembly protein PilO